MVLTYVRVVVQILIIAVFLYRVYIVSAQSKAVEIIRGFFGFVILFFLCKVLKLDVLGEILRILAVPLVVIMCILYQPELRRAFTPGLSKHNRLFRIGKFQTSAGDVDNVIEACQRLSKLKRGALIVFPRQVSIRNIVDSGTRLDADISTSLIETVFAFDTALHDGAMVIEGSKIVAAGCYLPLSGQTDIKQSFGTRHRAALGMADESDAVVIVVSEETSAISMAYNGNLYYQLEPQVVRDTLLALFSKLDVQPVSPEDANETKK